MENITFEKFKEIELKVATILQAEKVEGSDKLVRLQVDLGDPSTDSASTSAVSSVPNGSPQAGSGQGLGKRQIVAGIGLVYQPEELIGRQIIIVANLEPKILMGLESQGMLLAATENGLPILLQPDKQAPNGCGVK